MTSELYDGQTAQKLFAYIEVSFHCLFHLSALNSDFFSGSSAQWAEVVFSTVSVRLRAGSGIQALSSHLVFSLLCAHIGC